MSQLFNHAIADQTAAALKMLRDAIERCPAEHWQTGVGERAFWEIAFHVTHYADLYLTPVGQPYPDMPDWAWPHAAGLGRMMEPPFDPLTPEQIGPVLDQNAVARYVARVEEKLHASLSVENEASFVGPSGFFLDRPGPRFDVPLQPPPHPASRGPTVRVAAPGRRRHRVAGMGAAAG